MSKQRVKSNIINDYNELCIITMQKIMELQSRDDFYNYFDEIIAMAEYPIKCGKRIGYQSMVKSFTEVKRATLLMKKQYNRDPNWDPNKVRDCVHKDI